MQRVRPAGGQRPQRLGQRVVDQRGSCRQWRAVAAVEIRPGCRPRPQQRRVLGDLGGQSGRHRKTPLGQPDGLGEQPLPGQPPIGAVRRLQHAQRARHADRPPPDSGLVEVQLLPVGGQEQVGTGRRRRRLAAVPGAHPAGDGIVMQHQRAAAEPGGLRFHQRQHQLGGDGGIHRRAARAQDGQPGRGRQRFGRDDHMVVRMDGLGRVRPAASHRQGDPGENQTVSQSHRVRS